MSNSSQPLFEINIDRSQLEKLDAKIKANVSKRPGQLDYLSAVPRFGDQLALPRYASGDLATQSEQKIKLAYHLRFLDQIYTQRPTEPVLASSPATAVPVLGRLWGQIRAQMHQLILFYVGRSDAHQVEINTHLLQTVSHLTEIVSQQGEEINRLKAQLLAKIESDQLDQERDDR